MRHIRQLLAAALTLALIVTSAGCGVMGVSESIDYKETEGGVALFRYHGIQTAEHLVIPDEADGKPVVKIMEFAVGSAEYLKTITIGKNVSEIDGRAFLYCPVLEKYVVADGNAYFETDENGVLYTKGKTELIAYPTARLRLIKDDGGKITGGAEFVVPDTVTAIRDAAFYCCDNLHSVTFSKGLKSVGSYAFFKCGNLQNFTLPDSLISIGDDAFSYCDSLTAVTVPKNVTSIGNYAFFSLSSKIEKITVSRPQDGMTLGEDWIPCKEGQVNVSVDVEYNTNTKNAVS